MRFLCQRIVQILVIVCGYVQITRIIEPPVVRLDVKCFFISSLRETAIKINCDNSSNAEDSCALTEDKIY